MSGFPYRPSFDRRTPRPSPVCVCVCLSLLPGSGGPAFRARCRARHLFLWPVSLSSLFARPPPGWGRPISSFFVRPGCPWRSVLSGPGCPLLVFCPPPFFFPVSPPHFCFFVCPRCLWRSVFPGATCFGPWRLLVSPPPLFFFSAFPRFFFFSPPLVFLLRPRCLWRFLCSGPCALGLGALLSPPPPSPLLFFPSCLFFAFFFSSSVPCRWCGAGLVCVSPAVGCAGVCFGGAVPVVALCEVLSRASGAVWCCVVLPVVFGCLLLGLAVLCCLLVEPGVVFWWCCPCPAAWLAALWFGVVCLGALLPCVVFCGAVLSCGGVLSCSAVCLCRGLCLLFVFCRWASAVCVLGSCAVRSLSSASCAVQ